MVSTAVRELKLSLEKYVPRYRLIRTDASLPPSGRLLRFEADSDRNALEKARTLVRDGHGELWSNDELVCKF